MLGRYLRTHTNPPVFVVSGLVAVAFVLWGVLAPGNLSTAAGGANTFVTTYFEWLYMGGQRGMLARAGRGGQNRSPHPFSGPHSTARKRFRDDRSAGPRPTRAAGW